MLCALLRADRSSWSVIDALAAGESAGDSSLVDPHMDPLVQGEAIARDYLPRARRVRGPAAGPWRQMTRASARGRSGGRGVVALGEPRRTGRRPWSTGEALD